MCVLEFFFLNSIFFINEVGYSYKLSCVCFEIFLIIFSLFLGLVFSTNVQFIIDACLDDFIYITNLYKFLIDL